MESVKHVVGYMLWGAPVWAWVLFLVVIPVFNEWVNRTKWTEAQSFLQLFARAMLKTPLGMMPMFKDALSMVAIPANVRAQSGELVPLDPTKPPPPTTT